MKVETVITCECYQDLAKVLREAQRTRELKTHRNLTEEEVAATPDVYLETSSDTISLKGPDAHRVKLGNKYGGTWKLSRFLNHMMCEQLGFPCEPSPAETKAKKPLNDEDEEEEEEEEEEDE